MKIQFESVGRDKKCWNVDCPCSPENEEMVAFLAAESIVKKRALMSRDIDVAYDARTRTGTIFVGGFRSVGTSKVVERAA